MRSVLFVLFLGIAGCNPTIELDQIELLDLQNEVVHIKPSENAVTVIYFLSPECPLCINYSLALKDINSQFSNDSVVFYGIHSGKWFTQTEVKEYQLKYGLKFEMCLDNNNQLAQSLGATVTPEVFVLNSNSEVIY
ncbi:MAG: peroxiredoxin family protein, partial [Flavobacteriales bacterium]